jgi:hypothetical protein
MIDACGGLRDTILGRRRVVVLDGVWQHTGEEALHRDVSHDYIMRYKP